MIRGKKSIEQIAPYPAGKPIEELKRELGIERVVKLASNENPYGCSEVAQKAMEEAVRQSHLYPDGYCYELREALSEKHGLPPECFAFGTGSDGLIELICKAFLEPEDESVIPAPSFSLYETNVRAAGAVPVIVSAKENYCMDTAAMAEAVCERTKVLWLCNPNNPTGLIYTEKEQKALLRKVSNNVLVVLDEAYYEFAREEEGYPNSEALLAEYDNIIILRTFSKLYGLAGLRVGYAMASKAVIAQLERVRAPFNVNRIAQCGAVAALGDVSFAENTLRQNRENRALLCRGFEKLGLSYLPTATNFVAVCVKRDSKAVYEALLKKGYIVKSGDSLGMPGYLRVSVGTRQECEGFLIALEEVLNEA